MGLAALAFRLGMACAEQTLRDLLDNDANALVVKDREYAALLKRLAVPPDLVVARAARC